MRAGEPGVMLVPDELWTVFPKTVAALRDKTVVAYAPDKANRFEVESPRGRVVIEKDATGWKITAPDALKADSGAVNALLWSLRDLRASGFVGESAADIAIVYSFSGRTREDSGSKKKNPLLSRN